MSSPAKGGCVFGRIPFISAPFPYTMRKPALAALACLALLPVFPACDSHSWEDSEDGKKPGTKHLFQPHGGGHHHDHGKGGDGQGADGGGEKHEK